MRGIEEKEAPITQPLSEKLDPASSGQKPREAEHKTEPPAWLINDIVQGSQTTSKIYLTYTSFLAYCTLTVATTTDLQLVILRGTTLLPFIELNISFLLFLILSPIITLVLFVYLVSYLNDLKRKLDAFPKDSLERILVAPWARYIAGEPAKDQLENFQFIFVSFSLWWLYPLVFITFALWIVRKHTDFFSWWFGVAALVGAIVSSLLWPKYERARYGKWWLLGIVLSFEITFVGFLVPSVRGRSFWEGSSSKWEEETFPCEHDNAESQDSGFIEFLRPLTTVNLSQQKISDEKSKEAIWLDLAGAHLERARLSSSVLNEINLREAFLQKADLTRAELEKAHLEGANLEEARLGGANLKEANLEGRYLEESKTQKVTVLRAADLWEAHLENAKLTGVDLRCAELRNAYLNNAKLLSADLRGSKLEGTILNKANLTGADLRNAQLGGADFQEAILQKADFEGADFQGAQNLKVEQLSQVCTLFNAQIDPALKAAIESKYPHLLIKPIRESNGHCQPKEESK